MTIEKTPGGYLPTRREAIERFGLLGAAGLLGSSCTHQSEIQSAAFRPHIFISREERDGLRSLASLRRDIKSGVSKKLWEKILFECDAEIGGPPLTAHSELPFRSPANVARGNPDYYICHGAGQRILRNALAHLLTENPSYKDTALAQMDAVIDPNVWPDWIDKAHLEFGYEADLRTGMLSQDLALGFDWLFDALSTVERARVVEGIDRRGIQPFYQSLEKKPWWSEDLNNWLTVIYGGLGVAGMALAEAHPKSQALIDISLPKMTEYLSIYGSEGEFNESVAYSQATRLPANYFNALSYHLRGGENLLAKHPFPETGIWTIYSTLPPGRYAAFGDGKASGPPEVSYLASIAAASRNEVLQGYVLEYFQASSNPLQLLGFDPSLGSARPEGRLSLGKAFHEKGAQIYSRTSWDENGDGMIVYGKAKRDHNHDHNDVGQLCIDAYGERLITDVGTPSGYPADFFEAERWEYYNASTRGHNIFVFGGREQRSPDKTRGRKGAIDYNLFNGRITQSEFFDDRGGYWQIDLNAAYDGASLVKRTVIHLFPGFVAVLDEAELEKEEEAVMRWHSLSRPKLSGSGHFEVVENGRGLSGYMGALDGNTLELSVGAHEYKAPFNRTRDGGYLEQRREPFIKAKMEGNAFRILTLFALYDKVPISRSWVAGENSWRIDTPLGAAEVRIDGDFLKAKNLSQSTEISVSI